MATYGFKQRGSSRQATYRSPTTDKQREDSAKLREKRLIASGHKQEEDRLIKEARFAFDNQQGDVEVPMNARERRRAVQKIAQENPQWAKIQKARSLGLSLSGLEEHEQGILDREARRKALVEFGPTGKGKGGGVQVPSVKSREYDRVTQRINALKSVKNRTPLQEKQLSEALRYQKSLGLGGSQASRKEMRLEQQMDDIDERLEVLQGLDKPSTAQKGEIEKLLKQRDDLFNMYVTGQPAPVVKTHEETMAEEHRKTLDSLVSIRNNAENALAAVQNRLKELRSSVRKLGVKRDSQGSTYSVRDQEKDYRKQNEEIRELEQEIPKLERRVIDANSLIKKHEDRMFPDLFKGEIGDIPRSANRKDPATLKPQNSLLDFNSVDNSPPLPGENFLDPRSSQNQGTPQGISPGALRVIEAINNKRN